ncbi:MAG TPA: MBL fold metallo-hydrolase [Actinomycetota bacterium]|nr:MBL fold metallo-hydrolase [Actinomycetota bacterium]
MIFRQFYLPSLGHASYLIGDEKTGQALILDAQRNVTDYYATARQQGLRIGYAIDTHGHNDYLSGITEVAARGDVELLGFHEARLGYDHRSVKDGELIEIGDVAFEILHTPGHTPEHVSLLIYDRTSGDEPTMLLSGGALLVGDLARPDLLGGADEARIAARDFCHTIQEKILWRLPDHVEVFPTHVAGSLCGGNIGSRLSTTVGYERKTNAVLTRVSNSEEFVEECIRLDNLPAVPPYWRRMRAQNLAGPSLLGVLREPPALKPHEFAGRMRDGAVVLDARSPEAFAGGHIPGALNVGLSNSFSTWAGTVLEDRDNVLLVLEDPDRLWGATWQLLRTGYEQPVGWLSGGMQAWRTSGESVEIIDELSVGTLKRLMDDSAMTVLDVRQPAEWAEGHIPGARFITGAEIPERLNEVSTTEPLAVVCGSGYRSAVIASFLRAHGHNDVRSVIGGMSAWRNAGLPTESE